MASHLPKGFACVRKPTLMKHCCNGFEGKVKSEPQSVNQRMIETLNALK
ncbi:hypothetical protein T11_3825 [Trichinella zimbabwensis]|uniref:Uncharacterized protein n=1 Tax=Trichinella zimbabwensis TaxID=268475 RepID=A0A0V1GFA0_9BILA|nr:hypothetical protein T11_3825 [Trichinella zimbabwensis]